MLSLCVPSQGGEGNQGAQFLLRKDLNTKGRKEREEEKEFLVQSRSCDRDKEQLCSKPGYKAGPRGPSRLREGNSLPWALFSPAVAYPEQISQQGDLRGAPASPADIPRTEEWSSSASHGCVQGRLLVP